jgi:hypothetical protein
MLPSVENDMGEEIVKGLFPQCSTSSSSSSLTDPEVGESLTQLMAETASSESEAPQLTTRTGQYSSSGVSATTRSGSSSGSSSHRSSNVVSSSSRNNNAQVNNFGGRQLQDTIIPLDGFSIRPRDTVVQGCKY